MKYSVVTILIIISLFLISQFVGLAINKIYFKEELPYGLKPPEIQAEISPWFFISMILIATVFIFVMKKMQFGLLMKAWFFIAFTTTVAVSLSAFIESWIAVGVAFILILLKFNERDMFVHNLSELLIYGGVVALFAPILNIWAVVILMLLVSVYDFIAVNVTKHMIGLAKFQEKMGVFAGLLIVNKNEVAILGGGDIAFTLLFAVILLRTVGWVPAIISIYGATVALFALMLFGEKKKFYPAMPFITAGSLLAFALTLI